MLISITRDKEKLDLLLYKNHGRVTAQIPTLDFCLIYKSAKYKQPIWLEHILHLALVFLLSTLNM